MISLPSGILSRAIGVSFAYSQMLFVGGSKRVMRHGSMSSSPLPSVEVSLVVEDAMVNGCECVVGVAESVGSFVAGVVWYRT